MLTNIYSINQLDYSKILQFNIEQKHNLIVIGHSGIGKTEMIAQAARSADYKCGYINLSVLESPDMTGLPMIDKDLKITTYAAPQFLPLAENTDEKPVVLIFDEIDKALPELQNPCLEILQYRTINGRKLNIHAIVATGNRPDENAHSNHLSHALTNRCKVYSLDFEIEPWLTWAANNNVNSLITGFLSSNREYVLKPDKSGDPFAYCNPSPRAWTYAAKDLDRLIRDNKSIDFQQMVIGGWVGKEASAKFRVWLEYYKDLQPIIEDWLKGGNYPNIDAPDKQMVLCISGLSVLADVCKIQPSSKEEQEAKTKKIKLLVERVCGYLEGVGEDFITGATRAVLTPELINKNNLKEYEKFVNCFKKVFDLWQEFGVKFSQ